jgi:hypothetical protein
VPKELDAAAAGCERSRGGAHDATVTAIPVRTIILSSYRNSALRPMVYF